MLWLVVFGVIVVISVIALIISRIFWAYDFSDWLTPLSVCVLIVSFVIGAALLGVRVESKQECLAFEETKSMLVSSVDNTKNLENAGITSTIVEQNKWLANAKASVREYGVWSFYYNLGVEEMEYISLGGS
jgi:RsiW-degrading membrane proteinase PrsW (M82 family)